MCGVGCLAIGAAAAVYVMKHRVRQHRKLEKQQAEVRPFWPLPWLPDNGVLFADLCVAAVVQAVVGTVAALLPNVKLAPLCSLCLQDARQLKALMFALSSQGDPNNFVSGAPFPLQHMLNRIGDGCECDLAFVWTDIEGSTELSQQDGHAFKQVRCLASGSIPGWVSPATF